jgi:membrane peptidoglycan carboxypeptidase
LADPPHGASASAIGVPGRLVSLRRGRLLIGLLAVFGLVAFGAAVIWYGSPAPVALAAKAAARASLEGGEPVGAGQIPPVLRDAVIATEDERFYSHDGVDLVGVMRALPYDLAHISFAQGASTITEQLAKLLYLDGNDHSLWRKLIDAAVALKLEGRYSKSEILTAYLNSVYFGERAYGISAASDRYFGVPPSRLDSSQASLLAGLIQAPSIFDPRLHPLLSRERQADVLRALVRTGRVSEAEAAAILAAPLALRGGPTLAGMTGVDLAPGPLFAWRDFTLGSAVILAGLAASVLSRRVRRVRSLYALSVRVLALLVVIVGIGVIVRSFRSA